MKRLLIFSLLLCSLSAFAQPDRIELGYQTTKRGVVWYRPGLPLHNPAWRISRDTNATVWCNKSTGMYYEWDYSAALWRTRGTIVSSTPPLTSFTSGLTTISNTHARWLSSGSNIVHYYSPVDAAWKPLHGVVYQSAGPTDISATISQGAAKYTTGLWQDSDDNKVYYWNGSAWTPFGTGNGTVTNIATGTGLTGGPITSTGTISIESTGVTAATYGSATASAVITVNAQGQITSASNVTITPAASSITGAGNVTVGSSKISLGGTPTGAGLKAFSIDANEANFTLNNIGGILGTSKGGTGLSAIGSAGQVLRVNAGGTALEYGTVSSGGNGIYGGSGTVPWNVVPTITNTITFTATDTAGGKVPFNITATGNDPEIQKWVGNSGSVIMGQSDVDYYISSDKVFGLTSTGYTYMQGDSIALNTIEATPSFPAVVGINAFGTLKQIVGTSNGQALVWNSGKWAPGTAGGGGITGSLTSGRVTLSSGTSTVTDDGDFLYNSTNNQIQIGTGSPVGFFNVLQGSLSGAQNMYYSSANVSGDMLSQQLNANNANTAANSIDRIQVGGASGGDPFTQYKIGASTTTYSVGIDNSDADKYKISPSGTAPGSVANKSIVVTNDATPRLGIDIDAPTAELDVAGKARGRIWYNTNDNPTATYQNGAGTGVTGSTFTGGANVFYWTFTTGTAPFSGGNIATITLPFGFPAKAVAVLMPANDNAANHFVRFKYSFSGSGTDTVVFNANGSLQASTSYAFAVHVFGY